MARQILKYFNYSVANVVNELQKSYAPEVLYQADAILVGTNHGASQFYLEVQVQKSVLEILGFDSPTEYAFALFYAKEHFLSIYGLRRLVNACYSGRISKELTRDKYIFCVNHFMIENRVSREQLRVLLHTTSRLTECRIDEMFQKWGQTAFLKSYCLEIWNEACYLFQGV